MCEGGFRFKPARVNGKVKIYGISLERIEGDEAHDKPRGGNSAPVAMSPSFVNFPLYARDPP